jgi:hypothetical protein
MHIRLANIAQRYPAVAASVIFVSLIAFYVAASSMPA